MLYFKTLSLAVVAALHLAAGNTLKTGTEWAGAILQTPNGYVFTAPQRGDETHFRLVLEIPVGDSLVALYHTHPLSIGNPSDGDEFSANDVAVAQQLKVPSFIWVQNDAVMKEFIPGRNFVEGDGDYAGGSSGMELTHFRVKE